MGRLQTNDCLTNELDTQCLARKEGGVLKELGKGGGHKAQPISLPCYIQCIQIAIFKNPDNLLCKIVWLHQPSL